MPAKVKREKREKREKKKKRKKGEPDIEELALAEAPAAEMEAAAPPPPVINLETGRPISPIVAGMSGAQKAAAVIVALGVDKASAIYQYMDPEDIELLTLEVAKLGFLDSDATEDVLTEFYQMCMTNKAVTEGGL